jgi:hypothetical protein
MSEARPNRDEIIAALGRMIETADERGSYLFDGQDARWVEAAIELIRKAARPEEK